MNPPLCFQDWEGVSVLPTVGRLHRIGKSWFDSFQSRTPLSYSCPLLCHPFLSYLYEEFFARAHTHPCAVTLTHIFLPTRTHAHTHTPMCCYTNTHTHTCTYTDAHPHAHTQAHNKPDSRTSCQYWKWEWMKKEAENLISTRYWKSGFTFEQNVKEKKNISLLFFVAPACH